MVSVKNKKFYLLVNQLPLILFALFVMIPILEIAAFIKVGSIVGLPLTLFGILLTAVIGAVLVRQQGFKAFNEARQNMEAQKSPVEQVIHGLFILVAGLLLLTPGFLTDTLGFLFLIPPLRLSIANKLWGWIKANGAVNTYSEHHSPNENQPFNNNRDGTVIDGEAFEVKETGDHKRLKKPPQTP